MFFLFGPFMILLVIVLVVAIAAAIAGRSQPSRVQVSPYAVFLLALSLASLVIATIALGITTQAVASLIGPSPVNPSSYLGSGPILPGAQDIGIGSGTLTPSSGQASIEVATTAPLRDNVSPPIRTPVRPSEAELQRELRAAQRDRRNRDVTTAVTAGVFALTGIVAWLVIWPRARRAVAAEGDLGRLPYTYGFFVAGVAIVGLLVLLPTVVANVFRGIAPGVAGTEGHAHGIRDAAVAGVLLVVAAVIAIEHLNWVRTLRTSTPGRELSPQADEGSVSEP